MKPFEYIRSIYKVPAELHREIIFNESAKGKIVADKGNYLGVEFYDNPGVVHTLHPTYEVQYLDSFAKPQRISRSKQNYRDFLDASWFQGVFKDWLKYKQQNKHKA